MLGLTPLAMGVTAHAVAPKRKSSRMYSLFQVGGTDSRPKYTRAGYCALPQAIAQGNRVWAAMVARGGYVIRPIGRAE